MCKKNPWGQNNNNNNDNDDNNNKGICSSTGLSSWIVSQPFFNRCSEVPAFVGEKPASWIVAVVFSAESCMFNM